MVEKRVENLIPQSFSRRRIIMPPSWPLKVDTLYICFASRHPMRYALRSINANSLFNPLSDTILRSQRKPPEIHTPEFGEILSYSPCAGVGSAVLRSNVYIVGGLHPDFFIKYPNALNDSYLDRKNMGKAVFVYNTAPSSPFSIVPDMISPKKDPLVLTVVGEEEKLYVLSDNMHPNIRPPVFESYTLSTNSWEQLDPPPFLNPMSKYFDTCSHYPYASVVIGTSICVSTAKTSFKFDVVKKIWEPCMLFEGLHTAVVDNDYRNCNGYITNADYTRCGPPFGFMGKAVLFEDDVLICMLPYSKGSVVAYKIEGGRVVDSQSLMAQGLVIPPDARSSCIADCGNGLFCLVLTIDKVSDEPPILIVKPFFIKKKTVLKPGDILHCEVIHEYKYVDLDTEGWYSLCCFAQ